MAHFVLGNEGRDVALLRGVPGGVREIEAARMPNEDAGELGLRCAGMLLEKLEDEKVVFQGGGLAVELGHAG